MMKQLIMTLLFLSFMVHFGAFAESKRLKVMEGDTRKARIVSGSGSIDEQYACISPNASEVVAFLGSVDFSEKEYTSVMVESGNSFDLNANAAIEIYAGSPLADGMLIGKVRPRKTGSKYYFRCFSGGLPTKPTGEKDIYLKWKNNTSAVYAVSFETIENPHEYEWSNSALAVPLISPETSVDHFHRTSGYVNDRFGFIRGDEDLVADLGTIDFGTGTYNRFVVETATGTSLSTDAAFELYIDKEPEEVKQPPSYITIDVADPLHEIKSTMYGVFFEDINRSVDGGLYAEMIMNRGFQEKDIPSGCTYDVTQQKVFAPYKPVYSGGMRSFSIPWNRRDIHPGWTMLPTSATYTKDVVETNPLNDATPNSFYLNIINSGSPVKMVNSGYWGVATRAGEKYDLYFFLLANPNYSGTVEAQILSSTNAVLTSRSFEVTNDGQWHRYECEFESDVTMNDGKFALSFNAEGTVQVDHVSLFPRNTYKNRKYGFRDDVARFVADLKPAFIRWPGGCIVEGITMENRVKWKNTIGLPEERKGEYNTWGYHSTNGIGYHEFLQWCEDMDADGVFVCNAGMSCDGRNGDFYTEDELEPLIQEALDALEYALGDASTRWGAERAKNGHPEPFKLGYIEIGNENHGEVYIRYYPIFYDRIRALYPDIKIITCLPIHEQLENIKEFDLCDPHFYNNPEWFFKNTDYFDKVERKGYEAYVGEYAANMGVGTGTMEGALSEAAFMIGMERNSDLVTMTSYAPLIENSKARSTDVNLIRLKNDMVVGRSSYYAQKIFVENRPDVNLNFKAELGEVPHDKDPVGFIGFSTWETTIKIHSVKVTVAGKEVYHSDFVNRPDEWEATKGNWVIEDGCLVQTDITTTASTILMKARKFKSDDMVIECKVTKTDGKEGFAVIFGARDPRNYYEMTFGSYGNTATIFEKIIDGGQRTLASGSQNLAIQINRPYDAKLAIKGNEWECSINGSIRLVYDNETEQKQYTLAGLDRAKNEIVLKVVNAEKYAMGTTIKAENAQLGQSGKLITLKASGLSEENDWEQPTRIFPESTNIAISGDDLEVEFPPFSVNVLRIKLK